MRQFSVEVRQSSTQHELSSKAACPGITEPIAAEVRQHCTLRELSRLQDRKRERERERE
jgi:hypothetical protein